MVKKLYNRTKTEQKKVITPIVSMKNWPYFFKINSFTFMLGIHNLTFEFCFNNCCLKFLSTIGMVNLYFVILLLCILQKHWGGLTAFCSIVFTVH